MIPRPRESDSIAPIVSYLEKNLAKGHKLESLKWALINQKYSRIEIEKAIKIIEARRPAKKEEQFIQASVQEIKKEEVIVPKKGFWKSLFG